MRKFLVLCQDLIFGLCATASESSETQCLLFIRGNRRALGDRRRSSSGTRIFSFDNALGLAFAFSPFADDLATALQ